MSSNARASTTLLARSTRWWLNTALAQRVFGKSLSPAGNVETGDAATRRTFVATPLPVEPDLHDPGQRDFGDYHLVEPIGRGGMGVVYRARQRSLDREVALKLLSAGLWAAPEFVAGLRREARHAARLQHPNIVSVHEVGEYQQQIYYAMQLVTGRSLAERIEHDGPLPPREAAALLRTAAEAIDYAHRLGILHLDLKPGNLMLDVDGTPKITDFGLARRVEHGDGIANDRVSGTPSYMAPEQVQVHGPRLSAATDIWGLGAVLYEMLTGHPPFEGASPDAVIELVARGQVRSPDRYCPGLPRDLVAIVLHCLDKDPQRRYPSARALADDLGRFLEGRAVSVRPLNVLQRGWRWARREPKLAIAISLALLALGIGLGAALVQRQRAEDSAAAARQQTWRTRGDAAWRLVDQGRTFDAMPLLIDNLRERDANGDTRGAALERLRLGTLQLGGAQLIDAIATGAVGRAIAVDQAGERVAVADLDEGLRLHAVADGRLLWRTSVLHAGFFRAMDLPLTRVEFTRDGRHLITAAMEPPTFVRPHGRNNVLVDAVDGRVVMPPRERFPDFLDATYGADGRYAVLRSKHGEAQFFKVDGWQPQTPRRRFPSSGGSWQVGDGGRYIARSINQDFELLDPRSLETIHSLRFDQARRIVGWTTQPGGGLLALGHADGTVSLLDSATLALRELKPSPFSTVDTLSFGNDGRWLAAASDGRVFVWDVASGQGGVIRDGRAFDVTRIQLDAASGTVFVFGASDSMLLHMPENTDGSNDLGKRIEGARTLVSQFAFGNGLPRHAAAYAPAAHLVVNIERDGELRFWRWRDKRPLRVRGAAQNIADLHFDGRHVTAVDGHSVRIVEIRGGRNASPALVHPQPVSLASFTPDGRALVTVSGRELRVFDWRAGRLRFAPIVLAGSPLRLAISPDSRVLLATVGDYRGQGYHAFASTFDLRSGASLARDVPLPGPLNGLRFSGNGRFLVHWRQGRAEVRNTATMRRVGKQLGFGSDMTRFGTGMFTHDPADAAEAEAAYEQATPIIDAVVSPDGSQLALVLSGSEPVKARLLQVDVHDGRTLHSRTLDNGLISRLWPLVDGYHFTVWDNYSVARWVDSAGATRPLPHVRGEPLFAQAVSRDGRWLAVTSTGGVLLADRDSGEWATAALNAQLPLGDAIEQLAFAPDGSSLLARSHHGRWTWWPLSPETQSAAQLARRVAHLQPATDADEQLLARVLSQPERAELLAVDPGSQRPVVAAPTASAPPPDAAPAAPGFAFVDLLPAINRRVDAIDLLGGGDWGYLPTVPLGTQRLLGIDFDIRGVVALRMPEVPQGSLGYPARSVAVRPPQPRFSALHLLLGACCPLLGNPEAPYAYLVLRYADGSDARVPILNRRHVWVSGNDAGNTIAARIAWIDYPSDFPDWGHLRLYAARLANPHPDRDVASIAFEASELFASGPLIFAATAEVAPTGIARLPPGENGH